jgi:hypothetical protein
MPYSDKYKCIFIHIPKTGGTSLTRRFEISWPDSQEEYNGLTGIRKKHIPESLSSQLESKDTLLNHINYRDICKILPKDKIDSYFSFTFIRNPFDRLVSVFAYKHIFILEEVKKLGVNLTEVSFEKFCSLLAYMDNSHVKNQVSFLEKEDGSLFFPDFIGRFERYSDDTQKLNEILGIFNITYSDNRSYHGFYRDYYTDATKKLVVKLYERDLDTFKYTF